jgi:hypothetical protein
MSIKLPPLRHGGVMANNQCTAACRHCLYACSPEWNDGYISPEMAGRVCKALRKGGCRSVHIGGGEPFMDFDGLLLLLKALNTHGISVEYIETNAYWAGDDALVKSRLTELQRLGVNTLCISHDAYHAEFIPPALPLKLAEICRRTGFGHFLWQTQINRLRFNGRAILLEEENLPKKPLEELLHRAASKGACNNLTSTDHFHVDLHNRFIPPGCTGIVLPLDEAVEGLPQGKYPAFEASYKGGLTALFSLAQKEGFTPDLAGYPSPCNLCFHIRKFLSEKPGFPELDAVHYKHV